LCSWYEITTLTQTWIVANWGAQDVSHLKPDVNQYITKEEVRFLLDHCVTRMLNPLAWGCIREKKSSCSL
jgi:hypothetical protein